MLTIHHILVTLKLQPPNVFDSIPNIPNQRFDDNDLPDCPPAPVGLQWPDPGSELKHRLLDAILEGIGGEINLQQHSMAEIHEVIVSLIDPSGDEEIKLRTVLVNYNLTQLGFGFGIDNCSPLELEDFIMWFQKQSDVYKQQEQAEAAFMNNASLTTLRRRYSILDAIVANIQKIHNINAHLDAMESD